MIRDFRIFRLVMGAPFFFVAIPPTAIGHEQDDDDIGDAGNPKGDDYCVIQCAPVGGERRKPPRAPDVKYNGADCYYYQDNSDYHSAFAFPAALWEMKPENSTIVS